MKVFVLTAKLDLGGVGMIAQDVAKGMALKGHEVLFVCSGESALTQNQEGYKIRILENKKPIPLFHYFNPSLILRLRRQLDEFKPDIIHVHNINLQTFSLIALLFSRCYPMVWTLHDVWPLCIVGWPNEFDCIGMLNRCSICPTWPKWMAKANKYMKENVYKLSKIHIASPSYWLTSLLKKSYLGQYPITVVHNGIDPILFCNSDKTLIRSQLNLPQNKKLILFCGGKRLAGQLPAGRKGWEYLCRALEIVGRKYCDLHLLYVGDRLCLPKNFSVPVTFAVNVDRKDMKNYFNASDMLVLPTLADNQPLTVLEAMACKTPVIATSTGGIPEMIISEKTGLLCSPRNPIALAEKIDYLLSNPDHGIEMAEKAYQRFQKMFTFDQMIKQYETVYYQTIFQRNKSHMPESLDSATYY